MKLWRVLALGLGLVAVTGLMGARATWLAVTDRDFLQEQGDARTIRAVRIPATRGTLFDRRGEALAVSTPVVSAWADPRILVPALAEAPEQLPALAAALDLDAQALGQRINAAADRAFLYLRRKLHPEQAAALAALELAGVDLEREYRRFYPAGEVAAHVVGLVDIDGNGLEGLELAWDKALAGAAGRKTVLKDRHWRVMRDLSIDALASPGRDLRLSLDLRLQYLAYRELQAAVQRTGARSASLVMVDVTTGEILALVNQPSYNPNNPRGSALGSLRNRAVTDVYEPGSTVKPLAVAAALAAGVVQAGDTLDTSPGYMRVGAKLIEDPVNRGRIDLPTLIAKSSQVGITRLALSMSPEVVPGLFSRMGLGRPVGLGFPGEVSGSLPGHLLRPIEQATLAYGYGLAVTPVQLAQAYQALASRGVLRPLSLLQQDPERREPGTRVLDAEVASQVLAMLEHVVSPTGTAPLARVPGYRVGGKTGTARKVAAGAYVDDRHIAWFAGVAPISNPRLAVVVLLDEPQGEQDGGGATAAPVFAGVMGQALRLLDVPPDLGGAI